MYSPWVIFFLMDQNNLLYFITGSKHISAGSVSSALPYATAVSKSNGLLSFKCLDIVTVSFGYFNVPERSFFYFFKR